LGYAAELSSTTLAGGIFWANVEYLGIPCVAASFFAVVLLVAGIQRFRRVAWFLLCLYCVSVWVASWTDPWHHLLRRNVTADLSGFFLDIRFERGPIYTANVLVSYGLLAVGVFLLVRMAFSGNSLSRKQGQILLLGVSMPLTGNIAHLFSLDAIPGFDQTPVLFALSAITIAYGLFRWSLISVAPIARDKVVDGLSDAVIVLDPEGRVADSNPSASRLFKMPGDEIARQPFHVLAAKYPEQPLETATNQVVQLGDRAYFLRRTPLAASGQTPYGYILQFTDVTAQHAAEAELRRAKELAEESSAAKSRFVANVSHELRTPLTGVVGLSDLLQKTTLDPRQAGYLRGIQQCSQTLLRLINDVLDMSKLEAEAMAIVNERVNLGELIQEVAVVHQLLAQEKGIGLRVIEPILSNVYVMLDALRLEQILHNLLGNAVKFTAQGEVTVQVLRLEANLFELNITDTGVGIPEEKQASVFEAFEQADDTTTRVFGGTGLGLTITRRLVERMLGTLSMKSKVGIGTTMTIRLPLTETDAPEVVKAGGELEPGLRVLLAEDNLVNTIVITEFLKDFKCEAEHVPDGRLAVQAFSERDFDVILLDIQMPEMDGFEVSRTIRERFPDRPVTIIALTANAMEEERLRAIQVGMNGFVTKPVNQEELALALRSVPRSANA
jgi:signal transduction histidine kinase